MKIMKDFLGLYTICGGWISRPFYGTIFKEGDEVKTHHFGGSTNGGVTFKDKPECNFTRKGKYEAWCTIGVSSSEYQDKKFWLSSMKSGKEFNEGVKENYEWYKNHVRGLIPILEEKNKEFADFFKK